MKVKLRTITAYPAKKWYFNLSQVLIYLIAFNISKPEYKFMSFCTMFAHCTVLKWCSHLILVARPIDCDSSKAFRCASNDAKCLTLAAICDGHSHCQNKNDERFCGTF